jgi:hypothetical protein
VTGQGVTPQQALSRLDDHSIELGKLSGALFEVNQRLETVEREYQDFVDDFEVGLWLKSQEDDGPKLPSEALRSKLARREMAPELLGRRDGLVRKRERIKQRIGDLKMEIEADRSILSALKLEAEASGAGLRRAA